jgi:hypothetical protein
MAYFLSVSNKLFKLKRVRFNGSARKTIGKGQVGTTGRKITRKQKKILGLMASVTNMNAGIRCL